MNEELLSLWLLATSALALKMWLNSAVQGLARMRSTQMANPEDAALMSTFTGKTYTVTERTSESALARRASACWRNDLENIPMFIFLSLGFVLAGGPTGPGAAYLAVFVLARISHTLCYFLQLQPWRNLSYQLGSATTAVVAIHALISA